MEKKHKLRALCMYICTYYREREEIEYYGRNKKAQWPCMSGGSAVTKKIEEVERNGDGFMKVIMTKIN
jgi:hypothetical protein